MLDAARPVIPDDLRGRRGGPIVPRMIRLLTACLLLVTPLAAPAQQLPEGQGESDYRAWLAETPARRASVLSFEAWLEAAGVAGVLPTWQITRTASMWRECGGMPFEVAPPDRWPAIAGTLRFVDRHVRPVIGPVEAVSGYRNPELNTCARGSENSAHRDYAALDLIPLRPIARDGLFRSLCAIHALRGEEWGVGLGFYAFQRFHVDTRSFRRWGADGRADSSPCAALERGENPA